MFLMMAFLEESMGAVYKVGDSAGWTITGVDYERWASTHSLKVGDTVVFNYDNESNDVIQVTEENYNTCNSDDPIDIFNSGNDELEYTNPGSFYYLCSFPNRCLYNKQKIEIKVSASGNDTTPPTPSRRSPSAPFFPGPTPPGVNSPPVTNLGGKVNTGAASTLGLLVLASCVLALYLH
ncbi:Early nodulin-like protein 3 [Sesamum angolense]|uniref:Early nodulin-like protein 3 n=1 Tax=Sesamum angolense TaxID=2727404 RepID=A0AAE2C1X4_9LAMI|nr:Early nodulin-like protein 3 [Sesamum angolense]